MEGLVNLVNGIIWSPALIYLCLGAGLFYSIMTRFVQVRLFGEMIKLLFTGKSSTDGISSFQALAVSLAGRVGMGNIAGVAAGYVGRGLEGVLANNLFKISPTTNTITNNFLSSFLKNSYEYFQKEMSGSAMPALNFSMIENLIITLPPIDEQKQIADHIDKMQSYFDSLTDRAEQAIQLMQERRTALISAAVTGKIDVRGWVAPE